MLKPFKSLLLLAVFAILAACTANPITGRNQFLVVSENQAIGESAAAYSQMMGQLDKKKKIEPEGERTKKIRDITDKLIAQFDDYTTADGQKINGRHTLGENIADLGGLATAYDAMKAAAGDTPDPMTDGLSRDQRFFLNWATVWRRNFTPEELKNRIATDEHAPAQFRAVGAPSNLPAFAEAFKCEPGKPMVRQGDGQVALGDRVHRRA